jgi:hypothetical protein
MSLVTVTDETHGIVIGDRIRVADTSLTRVFGLLGKRGVNAGEGLWIKPSSGVHTFGMMFTIDVVGLDKQMRVIKLWPELVPFRVTSISFKLHSVIELPAGRIRECGIQLGDSLRIN